MNNVSQPLLDYIKEQLQAGVSVQSIAQILLNEGYSRDLVQAAFVELGMSAQTKIFAGSDQGSGIAADDKSFVRENITMDMIIEKFIPIAGAILLIIGFGYLIYANAWVNLAMEIRIGLGFFFSVVIIGGSFSLPEKMRYFTDIGIGSGVLLLYGTLIYGSRTTDLATAMIPEIVTLLTAVLFTVMISYFASKRNSKVILMLGMIGAYLTPFVIGQNDIWVSNVSFNAYLIYFFAVNVAIFLIGREISVRDIIPLNTIGLFLGISTLWNLSSSSGINIARPDNFFSSEFFTAILFLALVVFSIWSILLSAKRFAEKDEGYLSLGYIAPVIWFAYNIENLKSVTDSMVAILYVVVAVACFTGWHYLTGTKNKWQHTALYAAGLLSVFLAVFTFLEEFDVFTSMLIAYSSLLFGILYVINSERLDRFISYLIISLVGSLLSLHHILVTEPQFKTLLIVVALLPAMSAYLIAKNGNDKSILAAAKNYSVVWTIVASLFVIAEFVEYLEISFLIFYLAPLVFLGYMSYLQLTAPTQMSHDARSFNLRLVLGWFALGFIPTFFYLVTSIYPAPTDTYIFTHTDAPTDWVMIKGIVATVILFIGLWLSRKLQLEQVVARPSFILVIFGFATLLLSGNYIISAIANDLNIAHVDGGPRAIATTLWWSAIAIYMLYQGIKLGKKYHAEKLLGLFLLGITLVKVILYDISTMGMQNKIIVLMMVGGAMLLFSYRVRSKDLLKKQQAEIRE